MRSSARPTARWSSVHQRHRRPGARPGAARRVRRRLPVRRPVRRRQGAGLHGAHPDHGRRVSADAERALGHPDHLGADLHDRGAAAAVRLGLDRPGPGQPAGGADRPADHGRRSGARRRPAGPGAGGRPRQRRVRHAEPRLQPDDHPARQPAPRADRGQPAARRAPPLHRDGAGRRQRRRDRHRRRAAASSCPTARRRTSSTRTAWAWSARRSTRCCPAPASSLDAADLHPDELVERQLSLSAAGASARCWCGCRRSATVAARWATSSPSTTSPPCSSAQRQAAWAEVARRIAHEVKNPLTPIRLSAERLERKYTAQIAR